MPDAVAALRAGSVVFIYPEGRIGLDPAMWPERAKTGLARLALATGRRVVPVATWGSHEVIAYHGRGPMIRTLHLARSGDGRPCGSTSARRSTCPTCATATVGHAQTASDRIMDAHRRRAGCRCARTSRALPRLPRPDPAHSTARVRDGQRPVDSHPADQRSLG